MSRLDAIDSGWQIPPRGRAYVPSSDELSDVASDQAMRVILSWSYAYVIRPGVREAASFYELPVPITDDHIPPSVQRLVRLATASGGYVIWDDDEGGVTMPEEIRTIPDDEFVIRICYCLPRQQYDPDRHIPMYDQRFRVPMDISLEAAAQWAMTAHFDEEVSLSVLLSPRVVQSCEVDGHLVEFLVDGHVTVDGEAAPQQEEFWP